MAELHYIRQAGQLLGVRREQGARVSRPNFMKEHWNKVYSGKPNGHKFRQFSVKELSGILAYFPKAQVAFDLGCGQGKLMKQLKSRDIDAYGVDFSEEAKKQSVVPDKTKISDLNSFVPPFKVDIFFLKFVIAFIRNKNLLRRLKPFIKKNGGIVILTPIGIGLKCCIKEKRLKEMCNGFIIEKEEVWYKDKEKNRKLVLLILRKK